MWREITQHRTLLEQLEESAMDVMGFSNIKGVGKVNAWLPELSHENTEW